MLIRKHLFGLVGLAMFAFCLAWVGVSRSGLSDVKAQDLVSAKVLSSEGPVEIRRAASGQAVMQKVSFNVEDQLKAGDQIITGRKGRLVLGLSDGSQAVIAPQTTVVIQDLSQSPRTLFNVIKGKTRVHIEKLGGQPNPYRVNTPTAVIAVRGTIFDVLVNKDETEVYLHEGQVEVSNLKTPDRPVFLFAGQKTRIFDQRLPEPPGSFKPGRNDGDFKPSRSGPNDGGPPDNRRVADNSSRPDSGRGGPPSNNGQRPDFGRGGSPSNFPGGQSGPGGPGGPGGSSPSTSGSRSGGKRP